MKVITAIKTAFSKRGYSVGSLSNSFYVNTKLYSTKPLSDQPAELYSVNADETEGFLEEQEIEAKRNKSRLLPQHQNIINGRPPYENEFAEFHRTIRYKRRMFGRNGSQSNVDPGTLWPSKTEIGEMKHYESVAFPHSLQEMISQQLAKEYEKQKCINERQKKIANNFKKLDEWKRGMKDRLAKKEAEALAAKQRKDALIEEVRRHFGYKIDPKDEKFKEALLLKEKETKKKIKEEKLKLKQERMMASIMKAHSENN